MRLEQRAALLSGIRHLVTAVANASLYSPEHQQVRRHCSSAMVNLEAALDGDPEIVLMVIDEQLIVEEAALDGSLYLAKFVRALKSRGIQLLKILSGVSTAEIVGLVRSLSRQEDTVGEVVSSDHLRFGTVDVCVKDEEGEQLPREVGVAPSLKEIHQAELSKFLEIYEGMKNNKKLAAGGIRDVVSGFVNSFKQESDTLLAFAPLRALDEYTFTHSTNVCILNLAQAMALGIDGPLLHDIGIAAMLHDIGKLFVPEEVLNKAGKLSDEEWEMIRQHPLRGAQYLLDTPGVPRLAIVTAYEHHMKFNLGGYPRIAEGWQQNLCSQMTTVSDFYDALRTKRAYRGALEFETVAATMLDLAGTDLHPALTRNFLKVLKTLPSQ